MRKRLSLTAGLVAVMLAIVAPPFVAWSIRPYEPPLRVGMTGPQVDNVVGSEGYIIWEDGRSWGSDHLLYDTPTDCLGNRGQFTVYFDDRARVKRWTYSPLPRIRQGSDRKVPAVSPIGPHRN